jgi:uncharacterized protein YjbK
MGFLWYNFSVKVAGKMDYTTNHEYELKFMLEKAEYDKLRSTYGGPEFYQTNHYFDTKDLSLYKSKIVLRIREKDGNFELTLKRKGMDNIPGEAVSSGETVWMLGKKEAGDILSGKVPVNGLLVDFPDISELELAVRGRVKTLRKLICLNEEMPFAELDKNSYLGKIDHELEWEIDPSDHDTAIGLLAQSGISTSERRTGMSKYSRFIERLSRGRE